MAGRRRHDRHERRQARLVDDDSASGPTSSCTSSSAHRPTTNSGVFLRTALDPKDPTKDCYELNIAPADNPFPTGSLVGRRKLALAAEDFPAADRWHAFDVTATGGRWTVALDGRRLLEYVDPAPLVSGHIGLQSKQGPVSFRNLRMRTIVGQ